VLEADGPGRVVRRGVLRDLGLFPFDPVLF
jgi:hypothetical protein